MSCGFLIAKTHLIQRLSTRLFLSAYWELHTPCLPVPCGPWWPLLFQNISWELLMACEYFHLSVVLTYILTL